MSEFLKRTSSSFVLVTTVLSVLALGACSRATEPISVDEQVDVLSDDFKSIFADQETVTHAVSLHEAMARGILYNLDHRVSVMEGMIAKGEVNLALIDVLPSLQTGKKSSQKQNINSHDQSPLDKDWEQIDTGIAYAQDKNQKQSMSDKSRVAEERRRKVVHNIIQDVRYAYWRAASAQILLKRIDNLIENGKAEITRLDREVSKWQTSHTKMPRYEQQQRLLKNMQDLVALKDGLVTAKVELASLINLSPNDEFTLNVEESIIFNQDSIPSLKLDPQSLELVALMIRPEIREDVLMKRIGALNVKTTGFSAVPGIGTALGYSYDDSYDWSDVSLSVTDGLLRLFSLPVRMKHVRNKEKLIEMRRRALLVAVMSQVHLSRHRLNLAQENFRVTHKLASVSQKISDATKSMSGKTTADRVEHEMDALLNRAKLHHAYAEYQNAYGRMLTSIGMDPLPQDLPKTDIVSLTGVIAKRTDKINPKIFDKLLTTVKDRGLHALSTQAGHVVLASAKEEGPSTIAPTGEDVATESKKSPLASKSLQSRYND